MPRPRKPASPFQYLHSSPEVIRLVVLMYVRFPLSLRNVEDMLFERKIDFCHETVRFWWNRFGPLFAAGMGEAAKRVICRARHSLAKEVSMQPGPQNKTSYVYLVEYGECFTRITKRQSGPWETPET